MKSYKIRLKLHWTNSDSYIAGYPDVYVSAENEEEAKVKAIEKYILTEKNTKVAGVLSCSEISEQIIN